MHIYIYIYIYIQKRLSLKHQRKTIVTSTKAVKSVNKQHPTENSIT